MSGFTDLNREGGTFYTDLGKFGYGPFRIERTVEGNLLIRPRSPAVGAANGRFGLLYQGYGRPRGEPQPSEQIIRFQSQWGIFRGGRRVCSARN
jgi:hypothetical protein